MSSKCPYPSCGGDVEKTSAAGRCLACGEVVRLCASCQAANRSLARFCRNCRAELSDLEHPPIPCSSDGFKDLARTVEINDSFWIAPVEYRSSLWCLSVDGAVWRVSPFKSHPESFGQFDGPVGKAPFIIREAKTEFNHEIVRPYMFALSPGRIEGLDLLTGALQTFYEATEDEEILSSAADQWSTLELLDGTLFFLSRMEGELHLASFSLLSKDKQSWPLKARKAVGPFRAGNQIGVYTSSHLCWAEGAKLRFDGIPPGLMPYVEGDLGRLRAPFGRNVFAASSKSPSAYIPVRMGESPGFLCLRFKNSILQRLPIRLQEGGSYLQNDEGKLVLAQKGRISVYTDAVLDEQMQRRGLVALGPPFHSGGLTIGFTRRESGYESVTFLCGEDTADFPVAHFRQTGFELEAIGFYAIAGAVLFAYRLRQNAESKIRIGIWNL